jgi:ubiquinone/menaquinone biosynthesis C-methylase UbiE
MSADFEPHCCGEDAIIHDVLKRMTEIGCVFVLNDDARLIGIVTDGDLRRRLVSPGFDQYESISSILTLNPKCMTVSADLVDAHRMMEKESLNILPVLDGDDKIAGFIDFHTLTNIFSPERIYPLIDGASTGWNDVGASSDDNEIKHFARYKFAQGFIQKSDRVLDCACGAGYGSKLLKERAEKVVGVDISEDAISFAKHHYQDKNIEFHQTGIEDLAFDDNSFDVCVSIETIEHVTSDVASRFLRQMASWVKPGGVVVMSSPMLRYKDGKPYVTNPYHINEMPRAEFLELCRTAMPDFVFHFYYQSDRSFLPLLEENTGFCISVGRRAFA